MAKLDEVLLNLVRPMAENPEQLEVVEEQGANEREVILRVHGTNEDIARLIGRKGMMASALRQVMSVASHTDGKKVTIKFEQI